MSETTDGESDGWDPVPGVEPLVERFDFDTPDFLSELAHPLRSRIVRQLKVAHTIADVASILSVPVTRLYHHFNRLEEVGLIQVVATRKVAAVTERRYQVVAKAMGVAPQFFQSHDPADVATALGAIFDMAKLGIQREVESGALLLDEDDNNTVLSFGHLTLSPERKAELMGQLENLIAEFSSDRKPDDPDASIVALLVAAHPESI